MMPRKAGAFGRIDPHRSGGNDVSQRTSGMQLSASRPDRHPLACWTCPGKRDVGIPGFSGCPGVLPPPLDRPFLHAHPEAA
jgi:hypothetical protein